MVRHPNRLKGVALDTKQNNLQPDRLARAGRKRPAYIPDDPLLTAAEAAAERGQALSTFWRDVAAGRVPAAYYVSPRSPRWRRSELRAALEASRADRNGAACPPLAAVLRLGCCC